METHRFDFLVEKIPCLFTSMNILLWVHRVCLLISTLKSESIYQGWVWRNSRSFPLRLISSISKLGLTRKSNYAALALSQVSAGILSWKAAGGTQYSCSCPRPIWPGQLQASTGQKHQGGAFESSARLFVSLRGKPPLSISSVWP